MYARRSSTQIEFDAIYVEAHLCTQSMLYQRLVKLREIVKRLGSLDDRRNKLAQLEQAYVDLYL